MSTISVPFVTFNVVKQDYCVEESIRCALSFADEVCVNDGRSSDGTWELLCSLRDEFGSDRLKIVQRDWYHDNTWQEVERNHALSMCEKEWVLFMDVDEVFHEYQVPKIREVAHNSRYNFMSFPYFHFYGTQEFTRRGYPHWYDRHTKMGRRSTGIRIKNMMKGKSFDFEKDKPGPSSLACVSEIVADIGGKEAPVHQHTGPDLFKSDVYVYHYSWMRDAKAQSIKRKKYNSWYANNPSYFDGWLPDPKDCSFSYDMQVPLEVFGRGHPAIMSTWLSKSRRLSWNVR